MTDNANGSPISHDPDPDDTTPLTAINDEDIAVAISPAFCHRSRAAHHADR